MCLYCDCSTTVVSGFYLNYVICGLFCMTPVSNPPFSPPAECACVNILKTETHLLVIFCFSPVISQHCPPFPPFPTFLPSLPFLFNPILSLSSLSRSCKLQIRNIPPHMQWEVSANRLLTASRVAHYQGSQLGSCSGV